MSRGAENFVSASCEWVDELCGQHYIKTQFHKRARKCAQSSEWISQFYLFSHPAVIGRTRCFLCALLGFPQNCGVVVITETYCSFTISHSTKQTLQTSPLASPQLILSWIATLFHSFGFTRRPIVIILGKQ